MVEKIGFLSVALKLEPTRVNGFLHNVMQNVSKSRFCKKLKLDIYNIMRANLLSNGNPVLYNHVSSIGALEVVVVQNPRNSSIRLMSRERFSKKLKYFELEFLFGKI
jgi:hypothetical protein